MPHDLLAPGVWTLVTRSPPSPASDAPTSSVRLVYRIFVSHANADSALVDVFVDRVLRNGCNLQPHEIFYSSGEDTGILSGEDLIARVRAEVGDATLVVAIITPTYQTRPLCIAELGAAWARAELLMPLLLPGVHRTELEGVLDGMTLRALDDSGALDELHDRVGDATGREASAATWGRHKSKWLGEVADLAAGTPRPVVATVDEVEQLRRDLDSAREGLKEVEAENATLQRNVDELRKIRPRDAVAEALLPEDERERFQALVDTARKSMRGFDGIVTEALWATRFADGLAQPRELDPFRSDQIEENVERRFLVEGGNGLLQANWEAGSIEKANEAIDRLQTFLTGECSYDFGVWFKGEYDFDPDLSSKHVWEQVF